MIKGGTSSISCNYCREGVKMKKYHYYINKIFEIVINQRVKINDTKITIGRAGKGIARRPWHELKKCKYCNNVPVLIGREGLTFESGKPYKIVCRFCEYESMSYGDLRHAFNEWNDKN